MDNNENIEPLIKIAQQQEEIIQALSDLTIIITAIEARVVSLEGKDNQ